MRRKLARVTSACRRATGVQQAPPRPRRGVELAAMSPLCVQPLCAAADLSGDGRRRQGRRHPAFSFKHPSATELDSRFSVVHDARSPGVRPHRNLQPLLLRGSTRRSRQCPQIAAAQQTHVGRGGERRQDGRHGARRQGGGRSKTLWRDAYALAKCPAPWQSFHRGPLGPARHVGCSLCPHEQAHGPDE